MGNLGPLILPPSLSPINYSLLKQLKLHFWTFKIVFLLCLIFKYKLEERLALPPDCLCAHLFLCPLLSFSSGCPTTLISILHGSSSHRQAHDFRFQVLLPSRHLSDSAPRSQMYVYGQISHTTKQVSDTSWVSCNSTQF